MLRCAISSVWFYVAVQFYSNGASFMTVMHLAVCEIFANSGSGLILETACCLLHEGQRVAARLDQCSMVSMYVLLCEFWNKWNK